MDAITTAIPIRYWQNRFLKNEESEQKLKEMESD